MSRVGRLPIVIPKGVKVGVDGALVSVEGTKGKLDQEVDSRIRVAIQEDKVVVDRADETKKSRALHGLYRSLINNMITGVSQGFSTVLNVNGVGYRAEVKGDILVLNLGYSNPIEYPIQEGITIVVESNRITVQGINKQKVGQVCAEIRSFRPPEPYKGKGVKYEKETIKRKIGKSGVK